MACVSESVAKPIKDIGGSLLNCGVRNSLLRKVYRSLIMDVPAH